MGRGEAGEGVGEEIDRGVAKQMGSLNNRKGCETVLKQKSFHQHIKKLFNAVSIEIYLSMVSPRLRREAEKISFMSFRFQKKNELKGGMKCLTKQGRIPK